MCTSVEIRVAVTLPENMNPEPIEAALVARYPGAWTSWRPVDRVLWAGRDVEVCGERTPEVVVNEIAQTIWKAARMYVPLAAYWVEVRSIPWQSVELGRDEYARLNAHE